MIRVWKYFITCTCRAAHSIDSYKDTTEALNSLKQSTIILKRHTQQVEKYCTIQLTQYIKIQFPTTFSRVTAITAQKYYYMTLSISQLRE